MLVFPRQKAQGGFRIASNKGQNFKRLFSQKTEGKGIPKEMMEVKADHPYKIMTPSLAKSMEGLKVKTSRPKSYITMNL
jgi:hypothetical protein